MAPKQPHLSIIVPVFNGAKTLQACVESVVNQPFTDFELILVNDGSQDNSATLMAELQQQDFRIKCVQQHNQGLPLARNAGLTIATGQYISFIDCDDTIDPGYYTSAFESSTPGTFDLFVSGLKRFAKEKVLPYQSPRQIKPSELFEAVFCSNHVGLSVCNKIFNRAIIVQQNIVFKPVQFAEDIVFLADYFAYAKTIVYTPHSYYNYTVSVGSITNSAKEQRLFKPRDYEILQALDLARQSSAFLTDESFRHYFSIRAVRSALRLVLLMLWCKESNPQATQRAHKYIKKGIKAYLLNPHINTKHKFIAAIVAISPTFLLNLIMRIVIQSSAKHS